ncbi:unnamed protein product [Nezara viridula]|uniref:Uncharacterized protein n=1 Tax=Nezara viridula TaxID=85310 RepID=A0A9P0E629_NEZVI|nr:unnamed protein product [Nezara viridula]
MEGSSIHEKTTAAMPDVNTGKSARQVPRGKKGKKILSPEVHAKLRERAIALRQSFEEHGIKLNKPRIKQKSEFLSNLEKVEKNEDFQTDLKNTLRLQSLSLSREGFMKMTPVVVGMIREQYKLRYNEVCPWMDDGEILSNEMLERLSPSHHIKNVVIEEPELPVEKDAPEGLSPTLLSLQSTVAEAWRLNVFQSEIEVPVLERFDKYVTYYTQPPTYLGKLCLEMECTLLKSMIPMKLSVDQKSILWDNRSTLSKFIADIALEEQPSPSLCAKVINTLVVDARTRGRVLFKDSDKRNLGCYLMFMFECLSLCHFGRYLPDDTKYICFKAKSKPRCRQRVKSPLPVFP